MKERFLESLTKCQILICITHCLEAFPGKCDYLTIKLYLCGSKNIYAEDKFLCWENESNCTLKSWNPYSCERGTQAGGWENWKQWVKKSRMAKSQRSTYQGWTQAGATHMEILLEYQSWEWKHKPCWKRSGQTLLTLKQKRSQVSTSALMQVQRPALHVSGSDWSRCFYPSSCPKLISQLSDLSVRRSKKCYTFFLYVSYGFAIFCSSPEFNISERSQVAWILVRPNHLIFPHPV